MYENKTKIVQWRLLLERRVLECLLNPLPTKYSGVLNTGHWNTKHIGISNVLKFCLPLVQKQDCCHFVLFSKGLYHWKTEILMSLDHFIFTHNKFYLNLKWSRLAKMSVFQWFGPMDKFLPLCQPLENRTPLENRKDHCHSNSECVWYSSPQCRAFCGSIFAPHFPPIFKGDP